MSRTHIVFVYAGDLWSVPREGGDAVRITVSPGYETNPKFSPDGTQIAFTGEYDGNIDVFVVPATGGVPKRLTWHPANDTVVGWTPDGKKILFNSNRTAYSRFVELFTATVDGGFEEKLPLPTGVDGSYSPDGKSIAYLPTPPAFAAWKRYRGGMTTKVWLANLSNSRIERVPRENSNDFNPMWIGDRVYFLSDRNGPFTLYVYDSKTKQVKQALPNSGLDLKSASAGPDGSIVYEQFGSLHLFDTKTNKSKPVLVRLTGDLPEVRPKFVNVAKNLSSPGISPTGARALFLARGEVVSVPAEKGDARNLTNTPAVMERDPQWSPDGKTIAYFSDESGEYALHLKPQLGGDVVKIPLQPAFYRGLKWSPDSKKLAFLNSSAQPCYLDIESKKQVCFFEQAFGIFTNAPQLTWSPDSRWIGYTHILKNYLNALSLYSIADGKSTQITDGMSDVSNPVFDKEGKYLFFTASTDAGAARQPDLHSINRPISRSIYLAVLSKTESSPFAPESDEEKVSEEKKVVEEKKAEANVAEAKKDVKPEEAKAAAEKIAATAATKIDLEGIDQRILAVPMPARRYVDLQVAKNGVLLAVELMPPPAEMPGEPQPIPATVHRYDMKARRADVALSGVTQFLMAHNGEKALYKQGDNWYIAALRPMAPANGPTPPTPPPAPTPSSALKTAAIEVRVDPQEEWKQMFREGWRMQRDYFYDPNLHGLDRKATMAKYEPYLDRLGSRRDLTYLFQEMFGELTVGHLYTGGGDLPDVKKVQTGLLGCDYDVANGRYRFARVYSGENWNPQLRAPLTQPGVNVKEGEYLIAVNGRELRASENVHSFFEGMANKAVILKVASDANGTNARDVTVVPIASESGLRNRAWIDENRRKVEKMTEGRVAYIYMPDTALGGITAFNRYFYAQVGKEAAIIDERYNGGGMVATDIVEILTRKPMSAAIARSGASAFQPQGAIYGPKVMIINESAGSGGDAMPWFFRRAGAGKLIGTRTWGGLVGISGYPPLMDGGFLTAPSVGLYNPISGEWEVENVGISPDLEVDQDPELVRQGRDPQLERAVQTVMEELKKNPPPQFRKPKFPNYHNNKAQQLASGRE
ncbi:MAG TPA: PDZ domain-containing protein [Bryobacteraceae bacterium]|nr:PDZ domain-containing protein [Bryobacteraceae bacterium]